MAEKTQRGGRTNKGKKDTRKYLHGKQGKTDEIRRALTHRARLRKNYFKLLEREGLDVPSRESNEEEPQNKIKKHATNGDESDEDDGGDNDKPGMSDIDLIKNKVKNHEPLTFQERIMLKKDRREKDKERKMRKTREKLEVLKRSEQKRQRQTERIQNTKTRKGQPLMGPRINNLLEKIKQDKSN